MFKAEGYLYECGKNRLHLFCFHIDFNHFQLSLEAVGCRLFRNVCLLWTDVGFVSSMQ